MSLRGLNLLNNELKKIGDHSIDAFTTYHRLKVWISNVSIEIEIAKKTNSKESIKTTLEDAIEIHSHSSWINRLQVWPRGYQGDFQTIEDLYKGCNSSKIENKVPLILEFIAKNCIASQQHRNKIDFQSRKIERFSRTNQNILSVGCGGSIDANLSLSSLRNSDGLFIASDIDQSALDLTQKRLASLDKKLILSQGNVVNFFRKNETKFILILAGGLFDYLSDKEIDFVLNNGLKSLQFGGEFNFTNFSEFNPYKNWIEYLANWNLIYRSEEDIRNIISKYVSDKCTISVNLDKSGVTYLTTIKKNQ